MTADDLLACHALGATSPAESVVIEHASGDATSSLAASLGRYREIVGQLDELVGGEAAPLDERVWREIERSLS